MEQLRLEGVLEAHPVKAGSTRAECPGPYTVRFWISLRMKTTQLLRATCSSVWPPWQYNNHKCLLLLLISLCTTEKSFYYFTPSLPMLLTLKILLYSTAFWITSWFLYFFSKCAYTSYVLLGYDSLDCSPTTLKLRHWDFVLWPNNKTSKSTV